MSAAAGFPWNKAGDRRAGTSEYYGDGPWETTGRVTRRPAGDGGEIG